MGIETRDRSRAEGAATLTTQPKRVFVAEDDAFTREAIGAVLAEDGDDVIAVANGGELLECLDLIARDGLRPPDLILMDVCMPGASGVDVLEELRRSGLEIPVVLMTSFATHEARQRAREVGWAIVIEKPFTLEELRLATQFARWRAGTLVGRHAQS